MVTFLLVVVVPLVLGLVVNDLSDVSLWLAHKIVRWCAHRISDPAMVVRYEEEWLSVLQDRPGKILKLVTAVSIALRSTWQLRELHGGHSRGDTQPRSTPFSLPHCVTNSGTNADHGAFVSYYGLVPVSKLVEWYERNRDMIDPRGYARSRMPNMDLSSLLLSDPAHSWFVNNGIAIVCDTASWSSTDESHDHSSDGKIELSGAGVVNGFNTLAYLRIAHTMSPRSMNDASVVVRIVESAGAQAVINTVHTALDRAPSHRRFTFARLRGLLCQRRPSWRRRGR